MGLVSMARAAEAENAMKMTLLQIDHHTDWLDALIQVPGDDSLVARATRYAATLDRKPRSLPEGQWVQGAVELELIGRYIHLRAITDQTIHFLTHSHIPGQYMGITEFVRSFIPGEGERFNPHFCFDIFHNPKAEKPLTLGDDYEALLLKLKALNPVAVVNAFSKWASNQVWMYSNLSDVETAYVVERQLEVFGWQDLPVKYYDEQRRTGVWSLRM
jgi:hypothetical protein